METQATAVILTRLIIFAPSVQVTCPNWGSMSASAIMRQERQSATGRAQETQWRIHADKGVCAARRNPVCANSLVNHGLDRTCSNCAGVGSKEFGLLTVIDAIEKHKAEVSRENRVDSCEATRAITGDGIGSGDRDIGKDVSRDAAVYGPSKVPFSIQDNSTQNGQRSDRRNSKR